jgi:hypothetical protein
MTTLMYERDGKIYHALYAATDRSHGDCETVVYLDASDGTIHTRTAPDFYEKYQPVMPPGKIVMQEMMPGGEIREFKTYSGMAGVTKDTKIGGLDTPLPCYDASRNQIGTSIVTRKSDGSLEAITTITDPRFTGDEVLKCHYEVNLVAVPATEKV